MKQPFHAEIDKPVFVRGINKKAIIKDFAVGKVLITYFSRETDKRITAWVDNSQIDEYKPKKVNKKSQFEQVREFHKTFNCPAPEVPTPLSDKLAINRAAYIVEEVIELLYASAGNKERFDEFYAELIKRASGSYKKQLSKAFPKYKLTGQIDAFADILYFANGGFVEMSVIPDQIYNIVHQANMGKIFPDGKPHYDEVGKVIKPDNWEKDFAPESKIEEEAKKQIELGSKRFK